MKIIFMGNPEFALPTLIKIYESKFSLLSVVSNPANPLGRGKKNRLTPVGEFAKQNNISLLQPHKLNDPIFLKKLNDLSPDLFIVVAFKIIPDSVLNIPKIGSVNLHASLLPEYRGAAPIQRAIMNGAQETGITTFLIEKKVDTGSILFQSKLPILDNDTLGTLSEKMAKLGSKIMLKTIEEINKDSTTLIKQDNSLATYAPKIGKIDRIIDWTWPAKKIYNQIRGLSPNPGVFTFLKGNRLRIFQSSIIMEKSKFEPGMISICNRKQLCIQTGTEQIQLELVQKEGKRKMDIKQFLNGVSLTSGDYFET